LTTLAVEVDQLVTGTSCDDWRRPESLNVKTSGLITPRARKEQEQNKNENKSKAKARTRKARARTRAKAKARTKQEQEQQDRNRKEANKRRKKRTASNNTRRHVDIVAVSDRNDFSF